eukprot:CAMPEP_0194267960 /NCGR_PEP_ID=MMETSP0169-20130528/2359_1 /TAXON_ID=218684 /ORGANISM="Corethron pennatum, Strain L29A3" /LENGTH=795 /DNA_ID=CAMNT_0039008995 /DNA_START=169 /DNA_END=2559 /DNA_ORIENTATION=-
MSTHPGIPSLLIEAAREAARADGFMNDSNDRNKFIKKIPTTLLKKNDTTTKTIGTAAPISSRSSTPLNGAPLIGLNTIKVAGALSAAIPKLPQGILPISNLLTQKPPSVLPPPKDLTTLATSATTSLSNSLIGKTSVPENPSLSSSAVATHSSGPVTTKSATPVPPQDSSSKKKGPSLRRGKWTAEEEAYANRLIKEFKAGLLPLTDGTTLRTFLSKLLNCDPMRISKKFVGGNCIGKQVFRRRTADINSLTPEQIQQSRQELSELERRFLERVAQTNRVKSNGGNGGGGGGNGAAKIKNEGYDDVENESPPTPPWLRPPSQPTNTNSRAAAAGRALLQGGNTSAASSSLKKPQEEKANSLLKNSPRTGAGFIAELQRRSQLNLANSASGGSSSLSGPAIAQIARNASAAAMAGLAASGQSINNLMLKTGLSRDQLSQLARDQQLASSHSLTSMMERQSSFDALMSLDMQSLKSIDNLANILQSGGTLPTNIPVSGMKNWSMDADSTSRATAAPMDVGSLSSSAIDSTSLSSKALTSSLSSVANTANSEVKVNELLRSFSQDRVGNSQFTNLQNNIQNNLQNNLQNSVPNLNLNANFGNLSSFGLNNAAAAAATACANLNMGRADSSTGLSAMRMQEGMRNSSVDDFLSLVANGDIPHQDPHLLNMPLQSVMKQQNQTGAQAAAAYLAQQQILAQAAAAIGASNNSSQSSVSNHFAGLSNLPNFGAANLFASFGSAGGLAALAALQQQAAQAQQLQNFTAFSAARQQAQQQENAIKRKLSESGIDRNSLEPPTKR